MALAAHVLAHLTAAAEGAPRTTVEAATRALGAASGDPASLRAAVLARGFDALARLVADSDERTLREAAGAPSAYGVLYEALRQPEALAALQDQDPLAAARLRGLEARAHLLAAEGGTVGATEAARLLGISRQAVDKRRRAGRLLGVPRGRHGYAYPVWQFCDGGVLPGLHPTLDALADHGPWSRLIFFLGGNTWLDGASPLACLRQGRVEPVLRAARVYGEHVAA